MPRRSRNCRSRNDSRSVSRDSSVEIDVARGSRYKSRRSRRDYRDPESNSRSQHRRKRSRSKSVCSRVARSPSVFPPVTHGVDDSLKDTLNNIISRLNAIERANTVATQLNQTEPKLKQVPQQTIPRPPSPVSLSSVPSNDCANSSESPATITGVNNRIYHAFEQPRRMQT